MARWDGMRWRGVGWNGRVWWDGTWCDDGENRRHRELRSGDGVRRVRRVRRVGWGGIVEGWDRMVGFGGMG